MANWIQARMKIRNTVPAACGVLWLAVWPWGAQAQVEAEPAPPSTDPVVLGEAVPVRPARWAKPVPGKDGLPNLFKVHDGLYRGAQPEEAGYAELKAMGIKTVVNLRTFHSDRRECKEHGLDNVHIRVQAWNPEVEDVQAFLEVAADPNRRPVFVHCLHGADRTGMMVALYRIVRQGWSKESAIREMVDGGYGFHKVWKELREFVEETDTDQFKEITATDREEEGKP
jgi:protein tyrosine/serine phosphatase